jgi:hypothetical protein
MSSNYGRALIAAAVSFLVSSSLSEAQEDISTLTIENDSVYTINEIHIKPGTLGRWRPDILDGVLHSGNHVDITDIPTGTWDIKFVDQDNEECILRRVRITRSTTWTLTTNWLERCEGQ